MSLARLARWTRRFFAQQGYETDAEGARFENIGFKTWAEFAKAAVEAERSARPEEHEGETDDEVANTLLKRVGEYSN